MRKLTEKTPPRRPAAFTLIELLVAIGIIAILVGLLSPAIYNVVVKARVSEVKQEIGQLEGAIADFHLKFGMNPPSRITLYEFGDRSASPPTGWYENSAEAKWSRSMIRRLWPDFDFELRDPSGVPTGRDYNRDGDTSDVFTLEGDQCLVFFLGGIWFDGKFHGFSADPRNPFKLSSSGTTSIGPFMDFDAQRIAFNEDLNNNGALDPGEDINNNGRLDQKLPSNYPYSGGPECTPWFPAYLDTMSAQRRPYLYASSNEGLGYDSSDVSTPASNNNFSIYFLKQKTAAAAPDPPAWKPETFQIISPGADGEFGFGGPYMPDQTNPLPPLVVGTSVDRKAERDNITNFSDGVLDP